MKTTHPAISARARRAAITKAAYDWLTARRNDPANEEADVPLDAALRANGVVYDDDAIYEIWSDSPETLMLRVNDSTIIEIDVDSGNYLRGGAA